MSGHPAKAESVTHDTDACPPNVHNRAGPSNGIGKFGTGPMQPTSEIKMRLLWVC
jgi:hypothetical protein